MTSLKLVATCRMYNNFCVHTARQHIKASKGGIVKVCAGQTCALRPLAWRKAQRSSSNWDPVPAEFGVALATSCALHLWIPERQWAHYASQRGARIAASHATWVRCCLTVREL